MVLVKLQVEVFLLVFVEELHDHQFSLVQRVLFQGRRKTLLFDLFLVEEQIVEHDWIAQLLLILSLDALPVGQDLVQLLLEPEDLFRVQLSLVCFLQELQPGLDHFLIKQLHFFLEEIQVLNLRVHLGPFLDEKLLQLDGQNHVREGLLLVVDD